MNIKEINMQNKLQFTKQEFNQFINRPDQFDDFFEIVFDDIPYNLPDYVRVKGETHRDYVEDDGREYRVLIFKDKENNEYELNYTWNPDWDNDYFNIPDFVEIVETSIMFPHKPVVKVEPELTHEQKLDKELWSRYIDIENSCRIVIPKEKLKIPKSIIDDIKLFLKTEKFNMYQLRGKIIPVCIEYKLEQTSFWNWLQSKK
jgi:hypothetical protein